MTERLVVTVKQKELPPETFRKLTEAVREADRAFEKAGETRLSFYDAGTRDWIVGYFMPALHSKGLLIVTSQELADAFLAHGKGKASS